MKVTIKTFAIGLFMALFSLACNRDKGLQQYKGLVQSELQSGRKVDSIFFGIYLGMSSKQFYTHCWELNKKGLLTDGNNNTAVLHKLNNNELKYPASMNFYPEFKLDKITRMLVSFEYDSWAPWNKKLYSDSLLPDLLKLYQKWYQGNPFIEMEDKEKNRKIFIKVDGNRRIIIGRFNDRIVRVDYSDLFDERQLKK
ncbi:MAG: hypothetical protein M3040_12035 [Bacteroidota bacterium]|nr:hypothetical protein [Bacteroidota bacterium]